MRRTEPIGTWVVYRMTLHGQPHGGSLVCEQREWDAMETARPGQHLLVREGILTEQEAEKFARGTAGDSYRRGSGKKSGTATPATAPTISGNAPQQPGA